MLQATVMASPDAAGMEGTGAAMRVRVGASAAMVVMVAVRAN